MYPNLHFVFKKLFGWDAPMIFSVVQTYGFFLAITFVVGGVIIYHELKRKYNDGLLSEVTITVNPQSDMIINGIIGFLFGYKALEIALNYGDFIKDPQSFVFSGEGSILGGFLLAGLMAGAKYMDIRKNNLTKTTLQKKPQELIGDMVVIAAIFGLIGSKILAIIEPDVWQDFLKDPFGTFFSGDGIAIYGGLLGGFISLFIYTKRKGMNPLHLMDAAAPALLLGYGTGRMGCHFSGDGDWGIVNLAEKPLSWLPDWAWSYTYPNNVIKAGIPMENCNGAFYTNEFCKVLPQGVYPTSVYETTIMVILFLTFWALRKRIKVWGILFSMYLIVNGIERFSIETIRVNHQYDSFFSLSQAQMVAIGFVVTGLVTGFLFWRQDKKRVENM
ncbi:MAG: prolipoprotein diacylglyceryl transferase [Saprospiraceae bacterium]